MSAAGSDELVRTYLQRGTTLQRMLDLTGRTRADVARLAEAHGYGFTSDGKPFRLSGATAVTPLPSAAAPATAADLTAALPHTSLVARGQRSPVKRIKALADKCADLLEQLHTTLEEQEARDRASAEAERATAAARAEVARLEKQLADAKAKLKPASKSAAAVKSPSTLDRAHSKAIREWGQANGFHVGSVGRLKPDLVAAYHAAQGEAAAS